MSESEKERTWLNDLNEEQRRAVSFGEGPLLVVAGAGSGKTRTLAYRVAYLVASGVEPGRILLLTFTRRSAEEMLRRAAGVVEGGTAATSRIWGGTFHSVANRLLRMYAKRAGLSPEFTVMDQTDSEDMMNVVRQELNLAASDKRFPRKRTCLAVYSRCVNGQENITDVIGRYFPWCSDWEKELKLMFKHYVARKQQRNVMDYDDLLLYWDQLIARDDLGAEIGDRFDHILVDEYQDTNRVQARILQGMRRNNGNIMVVGDDAQSIYGFRAATVRNMLDFPKQFPDSTIVTLSHNYRSVTSILDTTNRVIAGARERYTKDLWSTRDQGSRPKLVVCRDETEQDDYVINRVLEHYEEGVPLRKQAVLFRAGYFSDSLEIALTKRNIPYRKYGGLRFLEAAHVKDMLAHLRIIENPLDEMAWFRTLLLLDGVGPATAGRVVKSVTGAASSAAALASFKPPSAAKEGFKDLVKLVRDLSGMGIDNPAAQVERVRDYYDPLMRKTYENAVARAHDLANLEQVATRYKTRGSFLVDLQLDPPASTGDLAGPSVKDEDWLVLSTIHSAKGCEWDCVYLIHASDGCLPSDMATDDDDDIEEERRLAYVALTRARNFLYVSWPLRYYHKRRPMSDSHSFAQLSRFFTSDVVETMDQVSLDRYGDCGGDEHSQLDARTRLRSMWD